ncbi:phage baseplate protein [Leminorella grimontii]|uniref:phage baseplate protein n=1 Tax=Leminorella grimontii TaxID=82981 RepID=UPI003220969B
MDILSTLFNLQSRKIGVLVPDVVISERHSDVLEITEHPVEQLTTEGTAYVADHAYRRPSEVTMEVGFAAGGSLLDFIDTSAIGISLGMSPKETYEKIIELQRSKELMDVTTGKRQYTNMLIRAVEVVTDQKSENVLMATLTLREVIVSQTADFEVASQNNMKDGADTSATQDTGTKSTTPANESIFSKIGSAIGGIFS